MVQTAVGNPGDGFDRSLAIHQEAFANGPVPKHDILESAATVESLGMALVGEDRAQLARVAEALQGVFSAAGEVEVVPPYEPAEVSTLAGKVATYALLGESGQPAKGKRTTKATDPNAVPTSKAKP